ncbi:MAG: SDR family oxidoreductase [Proteobacteria bacterium]|nr:SDR family oxidoreductase [Pseudomonadota bacterium]
MTDTINITKAPHPDLFCHDMPTLPCPEKGKVLITGATGYIGGRLVPELVARGYDVRVMVRKISPEQNEKWPDVEIVEADALKKETLDSAMEGIYTAYYLIHSMLLGHRKFESADITAAKNFREASERNKLQRIIYLGGLGDTRSSLSPHLRSRMGVADELLKGRVPVTTLRAAVIIGSGSASYEIIKHLVRNLYVLILPRWVKTRCQPIGIRDVIKYLVGVLETDETKGRSFDIGGPDILTYESLLKASARLNGKTKFFIPSPVSNIRLFSYMVSLMTPVPAPISFCLMEGIVNEVVCKNQDIQKLIPFQPIPHTLALKRALEREILENVSTRWSDAYPRTYTRATKLIDLKLPPRFTSSYSLFSTKNEASLFHSICRIGGDQGWFNSNWMWKLRGLLDRMLLGVGTQRGRKSDALLRINDIIDFWRIENLVQNQLLLLRAEMKLPGKAWLEFSIKKEFQGNILSVTAYYEPEGRFGVLYWYIFLPFHHYIFNDIIVQIEKKSRISERNITVLAAQPDDREE